MPTRVLSFQIEVAFDDCRAHGVYVTLCIFTAFDARRASQKVLLKGCEFRLVRYHAQSVCFQILVGDVLPSHTNLDCSAGQPLTAPCDNLSSTSRDE